MKIKSTGKIIDQFYVLGSPDVPVFLLDAPTPALFDAGFTALAKLYERDIRKFLHDRVPGYLFLTHAHYDHIGAARYFKDTWPKLKIVGSDKAQEILSRPGAIQSMKALNQEAAQVGPSFGATHTDEFEPFELDLIMSPGQTIQLGPNLSVKAISTPGHTWDLMSYWIPEMKILIASDAVGNEDDAGYITSEFLVDYDSYCNSLELLSRLNSQVLCAGHRLVVTGSDVMKYFRRCFEHTREYVAMVEEFLEHEGGSITETVARIKAIEWDPKPWPKQPEMAYLLNTTAKVQNIQRRAQNATRKTGILKDREEAHSRKCG